MPECVEHRRAFASQQFAKIRIAGKVAPQCQHVQEKSDQVFGLRIGPLRDWRADADVGFTAVACEQRLERRECEHEQRDVFRTREIPEIRGESAGKVAGTHRAPVALPRGTRTIRRDRERSAISAESLAPEGNLRRHRRTAARLALPRCKVRVLKRKIGQRIRLARTERGMERGEFASEDRARPNIGNDVVPCQEQRVIFIAETGKRRTPGRFGGEIKRLRCFLIRQLRKCIRSDGNQPHGNRGRRMNDLHRCPVFRCGKSRAQDFVSARYFLQAAIQDSRIERSSDPPAMRHIVRGQARFEPVKHPEPFLRKRQRDASAAVGARDCRRGFFGVGKLCEQLRFVRDQFRFQLRRQGSRGSAETQVVAVAPELDVATSEFLDQFRHSTPSSRGASVFATVNALAKSAMVGLSKIWKTFRSGN